MKMDHLDHILLAALIRCGANDSLSEIRPLVDHELKFMPDDVWGEVCIENLRDRGVIQPHPDDATVHVAGARWLIANTHVVFHAAEMTRLVSAVADDHFREEAAGSPKVHWLHRNLAIQESLEFLRYKTHQYNIPYLRDEEKRVAIVDELLNTLSTGQVWSCAWRATQYVAAEMQRGITITHAHNLLFWKMRQIAERAAVGDLEIKPFQRHRSLVQSAASSVLFNVVLQLPREGLETVPPPWPNAEKSL